MTFQRGLLLRTQSQHRSARKQNTLDSANLPNWARRSVDIIFTIVVSTSATIYRNTVRMQPKIKMLLNQQPKKSTEIFLWIAFLSFSLSACVFLLLSLRSSSLQKFLPIFFSLLYEKPHWLSDISPKSVAKMNGQINFEDELKMILCTFKRQSTRICVIRRRIEGCVRVQLHTKSENLSLLLCVLHRFSCLI